jgi:hypothetical protein
MQTLRWILVLPGAVIALMIGSFVGGLAAVILGQAAADTGSAFAGCFASVFAACAISPAQRTRVAIVSVAVITLLAVVTFTLSTFTTLEAFSTLPRSARLITPVAQVVGALYGSFICLPVLSPTATTERLWREIVGLGSVVGMLGMLIAAIGLAVGFAGFGWLGFKVGLSVLILGGVTWLLPFLLASGNAKKAEAVMLKRLKATAAQADN